MICNILEQMNRTGSPGPPKALPTTIPNLATVLSHAGYKHVEWHGKWHLGNLPSDYGFEGWQPPDAGNYLSINDSLGGGAPNNDGRFLKEVCAFLQRHSRRPTTKRQQQDHQEETDKDEPRRPQAKEQARADHNDDADEGSDQDQEQPEPFCLVVSFVNPHDVYVAQHDPDLGYTAEDFTRIHVPLPSNLMEDLYSNNKPRAQCGMSILYEHVPFENNPQDYVNFYAYLHTIVDAQIGKVLDELENCNLTDSTIIIRTADHGEQALSHSLVEKFYNCYEESIRVPFVVSNPIAFPTPKVTSALSSHIDIVPTLSSLLRINNDVALPQCQGIDLTPILDDTNYHDESTPTSLKGETTTNNIMTNGEHNSNTGVQSRIHFTYDDISARGLPSIVRCIRKQQYKYAVYYTKDGQDADWELYDLLNDPLENTNLAGTPNFASLQKELDNELVITMIDYGTQPTTFEWPPTATTHSRGTTTAPTTRLT
jgi:arylsulfatase A-like enzyme